jgi:hypothetical protein
VVGLQHGGDCSDHSLSTLQSAHSDTSWSMLKDSSRSLRRGFRIGLARSVGPRPGIFSDCPARPGVSRPCYVFKNQCSAAPR